MRLNVTLKERILRLNGLKTSYQDALLPSVDYQLRYVLDDWI